MEIKLDEAKTAKKLSVFITHFAFEGNESKRYIIDIYPVMIFFIFLPCTFSAKSIGEEKL